MYTTVEEIGRGSFGIVELVEDENGVRWACKTFSAPVLPGISPAELRTRFEREVRYQSQISHPNVVKIITSNLFDDPPWFIMELADCSLADELRNDRTLGGDPRKPLFDILAGLEAVHEKGYKHRDLKPANVLKFISDTGAIRYAISDFGLMAPEAGQTSTLTASNMGGGTPLYRPPECAISFKRATTQSDIYSFGAILHDIFGGGANRIPHTELTVAGPLAAIVQKCTKKNLRRRYKSVAALREELYEVLSREVLTFVSQEEGEIVALLQSATELSDEQWDRVFQQIDENNDAGRSNHAIFRALSLDHIRQLNESAPELFAALGEDYAAYAQKGVFPFEYCDVIADKAQLFYDLGELDVKARIAIGLLVLGTSHNRWFVERKFISMAGRAIDVALAERIKVEIEVQGVNFQREADHLQFSIRVTKADLHPILAELIP